MTQTVTAYYAYGMYVIRAKQKNWLECYFVGQQGTDVLLDSNMLVKMDERLQELDKEVNCYGCFEALDLQKRRFRLVRMLTETEKDEWSTWHQLYRELKWKVQSIEPHQATAAQDCKDNFSHIEQLAKHLQTMYPMSLGERKSLHSLLGDMYCVIAEFYLEEETSREQQLVKENENVHPLFLAHDTLNKYNIHEQNVHASQLTDCKEMGDNNMSYENTVLIKSVQPAKEELIPPFSNVYENQEVTEYFQRFYQLSNAMAPLTHTEDTAVQQLLVQLRIELVWIQTKILRELGIHAVYSENKVGELEFIQITEGVYASPFQMLMMHSLFESFRKATKDSAAVFETQKNTLIRMMLELFRDEATLSQTETSAY